MEPIDEKSKRLPTFDDQESVPVVFGDGGTWYLPRPMVNVFATFPEGKAKKNTKYSFGEEYRAKLELVAETDDFEAICDLAADMLRRNYNLSDDDLSALLLYSPRDEDSRSWMTAVYAVGLGLEAPKRSAVG